MRGLTVVVVNAAGDRYRSALGMACAQAALGGQTRLFLDDAAVPLAAGEVDLLTTAFELGVMVIVCQTGLDRAGLSMEGLDPRIEAGGMTSLLAGLGDDRLVVV